MQDSDVILAVENAVREAAFAQIDHLRRGRVERTFTVDLANALTLQFKVGDIRVDPFYSKHGELPKRLQGGAIELDIAIHKRGSDAHNLVAIELETNNRPERNDVWKVSSLTEEASGYGYQLGLFLVVGISKRAGEIIAMEWYKNGKPI